MDCHWTGKIFNEA